MKLSEAMILGSTVIRHVHYPISGTGEGCAIQCALVAAEGEYRDFMRSTEFWPALGRYAACPQCGTYDSVFQVLGVHLNDAHRWPIDRIAEWVAQFERDEEFAVSPKRVAVADGLLPKSNTAIATQED